MGAIVREAVIQGKIVIEPILTSPQKISKTYSEPCQTCKMKSFEKIVNG